MLLSVIALRLLDVDVVFFTATGCVFAFVAAGDGAVGSIVAVVDVVDLDVGNDATMLLTILMMVPGKARCSYRCC